MRPHTKHIVIKYHHVWSFIVKYDVLIEHIDAKEQITDIFTNPLGRSGHKLGRGPNMGCFFSSYVCLVYFLHKSTEFHVKQTECQRILLHFLFSHNSCNHCASSPFYRLKFKRTNAPNDPNCSQITTIVWISDSLHLKEGGDIHREERGGMIIGLFIWGRGVTWLWWRGVTWWHDDVSS